MKLGTIITVRSKSSRLPEKCFRTITPGFSLLEYNIKNAKRVFQNEQIIVATTNEPEDDLIIDICNSMGVKVFRGSTKNKIERWINAAISIKCDILLPFDGDDPFTDLLIGKKCSKKLEDEKLCLVKAINLPCGCFTYAINLKSLQRVAKKFDTSDSEMMWAFFEKDSETKYGEYDCELNRYYSEINNLRVTVDYPEDINLARKIAKILENNSMDINAENIVKIWTKNPDIFKENQHLQEIYLNNQSAIINKYQI